MDVDLDHWALLNIRMDRLAKAYLKDMLENQDLVPPYRGPMHLEGWSLWSMGSKWSEVRKKNFHHAVQFQGAVNWWVTHGRFSEEQLSAIDWNLVGGAMKALPPSRRRWVTKHASNN